MSPLYESEYRSNQQRDQWLDGHKSEQILLSWIAAPCGVLTITRERRNHETKQRRSLWYTVSLERLNSKGRSSRHVNARDMTVVVHNFVPLHAHLIPVPPPYKKDSAREVSPRASDGWSWQSPRWRKWVAGEEPIPTEGNSETALHGEARNRTAFGRRLLKTKWTLVCTHHTGSRYVHACLVCPASWTLTCV